jgi:nicotinamidase-related amidase
MEAPMANVRLLVMDYQNFVVPMCKADDALGPLGRALAGARAGGVGVIHVNIGFRPDYPEINRKNPLMKGLVEAEALRAPEVWLPHPVAAPVEGEPVVIKKRVSGFTGSDLDVLLRAQEVTDLVLAGIGTSGVVLATMLDACDRDFAVTVLGDACADPDQEMHRMLVENLFPKRGSVSSADDWVASL